MNCIYIITIKMDSSREQEQENMLELVPVLVWANLRTREE